MFTLLITNAVFAATDDYEKNEIMSVEDKIITKKSILRQLLNIKFNIF